MAIAQEQHMCAARRQLLAVGIDRQAVDRRVAPGRFERIHPGVIAVAPLAEAPLGHEAAALLSCGWRSMLAGHSAAVHLHLRPGRARPVHVLVPEGLHHRARNGVVVHRSAILAPADRQIVDGLPVTSPARTLLDVAATDLSDRDIERLLDEALFVRKIVRRPEIVALLKRSGMHKGRARLERILGVHARSTKTDSRGEEMMLRLIRDARLPEPELQVWVLNYKLDFLWRDLGIAVEIDDYGTHGSPGSFEHDRRRDNRLLSACRISVMRYTKPRIRREPVAIAVELARAIEAASATRPPHRPDP